MGCNAYEHEALRRDERPREKLGLPPAPRRSCGPVSLRALEKDVVHASPPTGRAVSLVAGNAYFLVGGECRLAEAGPGQISTACPPLPHSATHRFWGQKPTVQNLQDI